MKGLTMKVLFLIMTGIFVVFAHAQEATTVDTKQCRRQMMELCKDKKRGPELFQCIEANKSKLPTECQQKIEQKKEQWKNHAGPCKADREKLCADCMKSKAAELSPECKAHVEKMKADHAAE
jgi:hypothetical protein